MGLLDLDKIIVKRTVVGIRCPSCCGNLVEASKKPFITLVVRIISLGRIKPKTYECETCKKRTVLLS